MTLQERLIKYMADNDLTGAQAAKRIGIAPAQLTEIKLKNKYSPATAERIYKNMGEDYREYFEYAVCPYCGGDYMPRNKMQKSCDSAACKLKHRVVVEKAYQVRVASGEHVQRTYSERRPERKKYLAAKAPVSVVEYNARARAQGLTYGRFQGLERLGLR